MRSEPLEFKIQRPSRGMDVVQQILPAASLVVTPVSKLLFKAGFAKVGRIEQAELFSQMTGLPLTAKASHALIPGAATAISAAAFLAADLIISKVRWDLFKKNWMDIDYNAMTNLEDVLVAQDPELGRRIRSNWVALCAKEPRLKSIHSEEVLSVTGLLKAFSEHDSLVLELLAKYSDLPLERHLFYNLVDNNSARTPHPTDIPLFADLACLALAACGHLDFLYAIGKCAKDGYAYSISPEHRFESGTYVIVNPGITLDIGNRANGYSRGGILHFGVYYVHKIESYLMMALMGLGLCVMMQRPSRDGVTFISGESVDCSKTYALNSSSIVLNALDFLQKDKVATPAIEPSWYDFDKSGALAWLDGKGATELAKAYYKEVK